MSRSAATWAQQIVAFNRRLRHGASLPKGIRTLNPFADANAVRIAQAFYGRYYHDRQPRHLILGINPGRLGAGVTGIPFTDSKRLSAVCGIDPGAIHTHEPSSVFVYEVIAAMGGPEKFFSRFYINSVCPLGFVCTTDAGKEVNYNYYDDPALAAVMTPFIVRCLRTQLTWNLSHSTCVLLGKGKNASYFSKLNASHGFFGQVIELDHPRFVMQYKLRTRHRYVDQYVEALSAV